LSQIGSQEVGLYFKRTISSPFLNYYAIR